MLQWCPRISSWKINCWFSAKSLKTRAFGAIQKVLSLRGNGRRGLLESKQKQTGAGDKAHTNFRSKKINWSQPRSACVGITQACTESKLWIHLNLQQPILWLLIHIRSVYTYVYIVDIWTLNNITTINTSTKCEISGNKILKHLVYITLGLQKSYTGS